MATELLDLHDFFLDNILVDWQSGELRALIEGPDCDVTVLAESIANFDCPHQYPWGPSFYINTAVLEDENGLRALSIEMQSGDLTRIKAKSITINKTESPK